MMFRSLRTGLQAIRGLQQYEVWCVKTGTGTLLVPQIPIPANPITPLLDTQYLHMLDDAGNHCKSLQP